MIGIISYLAFFLTIALILAIAVLGLNLQWGYTGLFNGGIVAFFGAGAYGIILLGGPDRVDGLGGFSLSYPLALLGGIVLSGILALIVGLATTRLRHDYLAIATFGVAIAMESVMRNASWLTGGATGLRGFERPLEAVVGNSFAYNLLFLFFVLICVSLVFLFLEILVRSPFGRLLRAVRENERAARSLGKSPSAVRLTAFVIGAMIMGLSGALYATFYAFISPQDLAPILTFQIWAMLIVGEVATIWERCWVLWWSGEPGSAAAGFSPHWRQRSCSCIPAPFSTFWWVPSSCFPCYGDHVACYRKNSVLTLSHPLMLEAQIRHQNHDVTTPQVNLPRTHSEHTQRIPDPSVFILPALSRRSVSARAPAPVHAADCTTKVGAVLPTSVDWGRPIAATAQFAVELYNESGGVKGCDVEMVLRDTQTDPKIGVDAAKALVDLDKVPVLIGAVSSGCFHADPDLCHRAFRCHADVLLLIINGIHRCRRGRQDSWSVVQDLRHHA